MTGKADFTEEEWERILEGPPSAGLVVSTAERGGTFREAFSIAKAYTEAKKESGGSELVDEVVNAKPEVDRTRHGSPDELREYTLNHLREVVQLLDVKATPEEAAEYRRFVLAVANHVAATKEEGDEPVSEAERAAIDEIATTRGTAAHRATRPNEPGRSAARRRSARSRRGSPPAARPACPQAPRRAVGSASQPERRRVGRRSACSRQGPSAGRGSRP